MTSGSSSTLKITTTASVAAGTYQVTGTGAASHSATYSLTVTGTSSGTVTVQNPGAQYGFTGWSSFPLQIKATSSSGFSITYRATGLPTGLSISPAGVISGTPTRQGSYTATVTATDSGGATGTATLPYTIW